MGPASGSPRSQGPLVFTRRELELDMSDDEKVAEALKRAKDNGEGLCIELNGAPVITYDEKGRLRVHTQEAEALRGAASLVVAALSQLDEVERDLTRRRSLLTLALGALVSSLGDVQASLEPPKMLTPADGSVAFVQPAPKGKAS
jgi:hypothetical protein